MALNEQSGHTEAVPSLFHAFLAEDVPCDDSVEVAGGDQVDGLPTARAAKPYIVFTSSLDDLSQALTGSKSGEASGDKSDEEDDDDDDDIPVARPAGLIPKPAPATLLRATPTTVTQTDTCHLTLLDHMWAYKGGQKRLPGYLAFARTNLNGEEQSVRENLLTALKSKGIDCSVLRWRGGELVLSFRTSEAVRRCFVALQVGQIEFPIQQIVTAYEAQAAYPCYLHVTLADDQTFKTVSADIEKAVIMPYGGNMFVHVVKSAAVAEETPVSGIPRLAVVLRLNTKHNQTHARHKHMSDLLAGEGWAEIERPSHCLKNTSLYKHSSLDGVAFGLHLSGLSAGVQFVVTVADPVRFDAMVDFYRLVLGTRGVLSRDGQQGAECTFSVGPNTNCELIVRFDRSLSVAGPSAAVAFSLQPRSLDHLAQLPGLALDRYGWRQYTDPEGNRLNAFVPLQ